MKKLIVLSVVFALVASAAFAVDLGGNVIANTTLLESNTGSGAEITGSGNFKRIRIDGAGEVSDGKFGGYLRFQPSDLSGDGYVWWKPIDQFKLLIGGNGGDGFFGKEGVTGWGFYQTPYDTDVVIPGNVWGWGPYYDVIKNSGNQNMYGQFIRFRDVFYGGGIDGGDDVYLMITPIDILAINIQLPFFSSVDTSPGYAVAAKVEDIFKSAVVQLSLNLDFGNIALTYRGSGGTGGGDNSAIFVYYGGSFGDLALDVGFSYTLTGDDDIKVPMGIGVGLKYATDAFGVKARLAATMAGEDKATRILADVMPYFSLGDNLTAFVSVGIGMTAPDSGDTVFGWHFNPFLQIGEEWGAKFLVGVKVWSAGEYAPGVDSVTNWAVPIALMVNF